MCAARQMMRTQESNAGDDVARGDISLSSAFSTSTWHHGNVHVCHHDLLLLLLLIEISGQCNTSKFMKKWRKL